MSITPSTCGYIVTTKLNCSLEKEKNCLFVTVELLKALITAMFVLCWVFLSDEMSFCHYNIGSTLNLFMH